MSSDNTKVTNITTLYRRKEELRNEALRTQIKMRESLKQITSSKSMSGLMAGPAVSANPFTQMISGGLRALTYRALGMHKSHGFFRNLIYSIADRILILVSPKIKDELWSLITKFNPKSTSEEDEKQDS